MSFRWRLTLTYSGLLAATLLLVGALSYWAFERTLYANLDDALRSAAERFAEQERQGLEPSPDVQVRLDAINRTQPIRLTVFDAQGQERDLGPSRVGFLGRAGATQVGRERVFMLENSGLWFQASQSDASIRIALERLLNLELLAALPLLLLSALMGYGIADRALKPVDQVSSLASRIAKEGQPGARVPQAPGHDELARLTETVNAMLAQLERQLTRERLFAHLSAHELRTPISVIRAATTLALERERNACEYRAALEQVQRVSEEMTDLTSRLLAIARAATPNDPKPINLADLALLVAEKLEAEALAKGVQLQITADDAPTHGDPSALVLAVGNLVQNAIRHSPRNAVVDIQSGRDLGRAVLGVRDRGPGIDELEVSRLLQPFQRGAVAEAGGAGLGLALTQAIVTAHGGKLELCNAPESGLLAQISLPLHAND